MNRGLKTKPATAVVAPEDDAPAEPVIPRIGAMIKKLRLDKRLSLVQLAELSDVSSGMLSQIERDLANPSLRVLTQIRLALDVPISRLFPEQEEAGKGPGFVFRAAKRPMLDFGYLRKELLSAGSLQNLQLMILHVPPGSSSGERPISYPGEKAGLVLEGTLLLRIDDDDALLETGDSFVFDSARGHSFKNISSRVARILWIIAAATPENRL